MRKKLAKHLGRSRDNDYTCMDLPIFDYIIKTIKPKNLLDIGCANGVVVEYFLNKNIVAYGIDGDPWAINEYSKIKVRNSLFLHDYTTGISDIDMRFDIIISYDVLDHIEERFLGNILVDFMKSDKLLITTPGPGCPGWHHVNCQPTEYWIKKFKTIDYIFNEELTEYLRLISRITDPYYNHCDLSNPKNHLMYFERQ